MANKRLTIFIKTDNCFEWGIDLIFRPKNGPHETYGGQRQIEEQNIRTRHPVMHHKMSIVFEYILGYCVFLILPSFYKCFCLVRVNQFLLTPSCHASQNVYCLWIYILLRSLDVFDVDVDDAALCCQSPQGIHYWYEIGQKISKPANRAIYTLIPVHLGPIYREGDIHKTYNTLYIIQCRGRRISGNECDCLGPCRRYTQRRRRWGSG